MAARIGRITIYAGQSPATDAKFLLGRSRGFAARLDARLGVIVMATKKATKTKKASPKKAAGKTAKKSKK